MNFTDRFIERPVLAIVINLLIDLSYTLFDPRIKY